MDKIKATITVTFLGLGPQRFFEEQISYSLSGLEGSDSILATCMQASLSLFLWLAWLFLGNIGLLITADRWRGMGSGAGAADELDPSLPCAGEVRTDSVLPEKTKTLNTYGSFGSLPRQFRLRIFKAIDIKIHVKDLIKTMLSQVEHLFRFRFWSDRDTAICETHLLHDTLAPKSNRKKFHKIIPLSERGTNSLVISEHQ